MRPTRPTPVSRLAVALGLTVAFGSFAAPARAAEDDARPVEGGGIIDKVLTGIGLQRDGQEALINYQERAPLVIPQRLDLPTPEKNDVAARNPAWPKDPDIARRKQAAEQAKLRRTSDEREREQNPLSQSELTPGAKPARRTASAGNGVTAENGYQAQGGDFGNPVKPSELGYKGGIFGSMFGGGKDDTEVGTFTREPPRASLTEPPAGYQTPSPDQPYGVGKVAPKATNDYATRGELQR